MSNYETVDCAGYIDALLTSRTDAEGTSNGANWYGAYLEAYMHELQENPELYEQEFIEAEQLLKRLKAQD